MSITAWAKVLITRREKRTTFSSSYSSSSTRHDGKKEYVVKMNGWSGELRKWMTDEEAEEWRRRSNRKAFLSAAEASKKGLYGIEQFSKRGDPSANRIHSFGRLVKHAFADREENKDEPKDSK